MANIDIKNISELDLNGKSLFDDSESFITELSDDSDQESIMGGKNEGCLYTIKFCGNTYFTCGRTAVV